jgi:hypothetical protein
MSAIAGAEPSPWRPKSFILPLHSDKALIKSAAAIDSKGDGEGVETGTLLLVIALVIDGAVTEDDINECGFKGPRELPLIEVAKVCARHIAVVDADLFIACWCLE